MRRIAILAEGSFSWHYGKTATGVIRSRVGSHTILLVGDDCGSGKISARNFPLF